jgi:cell division septation protein DedD
MVSILDLQGRPDMAEEPSSAIEEQINTMEPAAEAPEFEFVLGRRQVASLLFLFTVILTLCAAASYVAGKSMAPKESAPVPTAVTAREPEPPPIIMYQEPAPAKEPPLLAEPKNGSVYIQMGAVEKGVAVIFAEGLRKRGLPSFVAPGPSEKIFRVLIGPLPDPASYMKAKDAVDQIGLATFARKFPN